MRSMRVNCRQKFSVSVYHQLQITYDLWVYRWMLTITFSTQKPKKGFYTNSKTLIVLKTNFTKSDRINLFIWVCREKFLNNSILICFNYSINYVSVTNRTNLSALVASGWLLKVVSKQISLITGKPKI